MLNNMPETAQVSAWTRRMARAVKFTIEQRRRAEGNTNNGNEEMATTVSRRKVATFTIGE